MFATSYMSSKTNTFTCKRNSKIVYFFIFPSVITAYLKKLQDAQWKNVRKKGFAVYKYKKMSINDEFHDENCV